MPSLQPVSHAYRLNDDSSKQHNACRSGQDACKLRQILREINNVTPPSLAAISPSPSSSGRIESPNPGRAILVSVGLVAGFTTLIIIFVIWACFHYGRRRSAAQREHMHYVMNKYLPKLGASWSSQDIESSRPTSSRKHHTHSLPRYAPTSSRGRTVVEPANPLKELIEREKEKEMKIQEWAQSAGVPQSEAASSTVAPPKRMLAVTGIRSEASGDADQSDFEETDARLGPRSLRALAIQTSSSNFEDARLGAKSLRALAMQTQTAETGDTTTTGSSELTFMRPSTFRSSRKQLPSIPEPDDEDAPLSSDHLSRIPIRSNGSSPTRKKPQSKKSLRKKKSRSPDLVLTSRWSSSGYSSPKSSRRAGGSPGPSGHYGVFLYSSARSVSEVSLSAASEARSNASSNARMADLRAAQERWGVRM
ncbi:hypothetical protein HGRIS_013276 [Hohenbuehelia grisea]|uniref:Uncharacterized protein n=1 Tax=Hohenbuehelia grisea TaxID=104357 RepID=A0ABR3IV55_9AGAR